MNSRRNSLVERLLNGVDAYEVSNADTLPMQAVAKAANKGVIENVGANFDAQFDLNLLAVYFTVAAGAYTLRTAAYIQANAAQLATQIACFTFGISDFWAGYKKTQSRFPLTGGWVYENPFIYGNGYPATSFGVLDATASAQLQKGDVVLPITAVVGGVNYVALMIIRSGNVAYSTLLTATSSDRFVLSKIRYVQNDTSAAGLAQYNNPIWWFKQSLFGKADEDNISASSQKGPQDFQNGVIDINIVKEINKEVSFGSYINYNAVNLQWSIFVRTAKKLQ